ncbi:MAG: FAD-dependent oxidoreductase, partial [Gammaproteobacteria bacterium]|nr:FAD-dependent oxidoreductase [Gammaproteobacteria bacterium]
SITVNDQRVEIEQLILATPPPVTQKLLTGIPACDDITQQLSRLDYEPVTTVYLQYPSQTRLPVPMMGLLNSTGEWLFDRAHCQQPGLIAVVISAGGSHMALEQDQLATTIAGELASLFPDWPAADHVQVIREKRATLRCVVNIDRDRPGIQTAIPNLRLCGDYVYIEDNQQPGLPSTLEGAMRSGVKCALQLIQDKH